MWNAIGVSRHNLEVTQILNENHIDIMLLVETHLTNKYNFQIRGYTFYRSDHPDGKARNRHPNQGTHQAPLSPKVFN